MKVKHLIDIMSDFQEVRVYDPLDRCIASGKMIDVYYNEKVADKEIFLIMPQKDFLSVITKTC